MVTVNAPRFEITECNNELERQFIELIHLRSEADGWYPGVVWTHDDRLVLGVDIIDCELNCVLRSLRVDFYGQKVLFGDDETYQFVTDLDPYRSGVSMLSNRPVQEMAGIVADWLIGQIRRQIVCRQWLYDCDFREWVYEDDPNRGLVNSGTRVRGRAPDKIIPVVIETG